MLRRTLLAIVTGLAVFPGRISTATEAEPRPVLADFSPAARVWLDQKLARSGFLLTGETRKKGDFMIVTASRGNTAWRLVIDARTGDIIGLRPLATMLNIEE